MLLDRSWTCQGIVTKGPGDDGESKRRSMAPTPIFIATASLIFNVVGGGQRRRFPLILYRRTEILIS